MRVVILSDTHAPYRWRRCPPAVAKVLDEADAILHAGDVCTVDVLEELQTWAPVYAVLGNNDGADVAAWGAPESQQLDLAGVTVAMIHDSGPSAGRAGRMRRLFPAAGMVVFGHSHIPMCTAVDGQLLLNPGSPTDRRRQPHGTVATVTITDGVLGDADLIEVS